MGDPKFRASFAYPATVFCYFSLSFGLFRGILVVFEALGHSKCARLELRCEPRTPFELDEQKFSRNLRAGPSGMTTGHLRPLLDDRRALHSFYRMCDMLAKAPLPPSVVAFIKFGRQAALTKPSGGVGGIFAVNVVRKLVAKTIAKQLTMLGESNGAIGHGRLLAKPTEANFSVIVFWPNFLLLLLCFFLWLLLCVVVCCCCVLLCCFVLLLLCGGFGLRRTAQPKNSKRAHFRALALQAPPKFHEDTQRDTMRAKRWEREEKREILGLPPFGVPTLRLRPNVVLLLLLLL